MVVAAKLLYAAPAWAENAVKFDVNRKAFNRPLRLAAIRITRCYRTVSTAAALALAGIPPGDLLALERLSLRRSRLADPSRHPSSFARRAREDTMRKWQSCWSTMTEVAGWTRRVLPSVVRWVSRPPGAPLTFHLAQALTGHGAFNEYLHRFGIIASPVCDHCEAPVDDVGHTIFACPQWSSYRTTINSMMTRSVAPEDVEELLCGDGSDHNAWVPRRRAFLDMVEAVMGSKEQAERDRQRGAPP